MEGIITQKKIDSEYKVCENECATMESVIGDQSANECSLLPEDKEQEVSSSITSENDGRELIKTVAMDTGLSLVVSIALGNSDIVTSADLPIAMTTTSDHVAMGTRQPIAIEMNHNDDINTTKPIVKSPSSLYEANRTIYGEGVPRDNSFRKRSQRDYTTSKCKKMCNNLSKMTSSNGPTCEMETGDLPSLTKSTPTTHPIYCIGDLVWSRITPKSPWCPSMVTYDPKMVVFFKKTRGRMEYHVQWFGARASRSWVPASQMHPVTSPDKHPLEKRTSGTISLKELKRAFQLTNRERKIEFIYNFSQDKPLPSVTKQQKSKPKQSSRASEECVGGVNQSGGVVRSSEVGVNVSSLGSALSSSLIATKGEESTPGCHSNQTHPPDTHPHLEDTNVSVLLTPPESSPSISPQPSEVGQFSDVLTNHISDEPAIIKAVNHKKSKSKKSKLHVSLDDHTPSVLGPGECSICLKGSKEVIICDKCKRGVHHDCIGLTHLPAFPFVCDECLLLETQCFICKSSRGEPIACREKSCYLRYHEACIKDKEGFVWLKDGFKCPAHCCMRCKLSTNSQPSKAHLITCERCLLTLHNNSECLVAGCEILGNGSMLCYRHFKEEKRSGYARKGKRKVPLNINLDWCFLCGEGGLLLCCDVCSTAYHTKCLKSDEEDEKDQQICQANKMAPPEESKMLFPDEKGKQLPQNDSNDKGPQDDSNDKGPQDDSSDKVPQDDSSDKGPRDDSSDKGPQDDSSDKGPRDDSSDKGPRDDSSDKGPQDDSSDKGPQDDSSDKGPRDDSSDKGPQDDSSDKGPRDDSSDKGPRYDSSDKGPQDDSSDKGPRDDSSDTMDVFNLNGEVTELADHPASLCSGGNEWLCPDCRVHNQITYGSLAWCKCGSHRWWPCEVIHPNKVDPGVMKTKPCNCTFLVQFFGTKEHWWTHHGRCVPYHKPEVGGAQRNDFILKVKGKVEASLKKAYEEVAQRAEEKDKAKKTSKKYTSLKNNKYLVPVPMSDVSQGACQCTEQCPCSDDGVCYNRAMKMECSGETCRLGEVCQNRRISEKKYVHCQPLFTGAKGWGLKTCQDIQSGEFVIEYIGEVIDDAMCKERLERYMRNGKNCFYILSLDKGIYIDAASKASLARFINHSCQPNLETQKWLVGGRTCIGLFALSDIPSGTELTFDYQLDTLGHSKMKCHCGAENCSGFLGEKVKGRAGNVQVAEKGNGSGSKSTLKKKKIKSKRHSSASKQKEDIS